MVTAGQVMKKGFRVPREKKKKSGAWGGGPENQPYFRKTKGCDEGKRFGGKGKTLAGKKSSLR